MVHRRSVLKLGAAGVVGACLPGPVPALGAASIDVAASFHGVVFDERFDESVYFARELRPASSLTASASDVAHLWYRDLHVRPGQTAPIAGLTDRATLFALEELSRTAGMRVIYRIDHLIDARGRAEHDPAGPIEIVAAANKLMSAPGFGRDMAILARRFRASECSCHDTAAIKRTGPFSPELDIALVSWLIA